MSSGAVRTAFETAWSILLPTLPLEDTLNEEPDRKTLASEWATVDYLSLGENRASLGVQACRRELGTITVIIFVKAGYGSAQAILLADQVRTAFRDWKDPSGKISITGVDPGETGEGSDGRWFAASINLTYKFDQYI